MPSTHSSLQTRLDKITSDTRGLVQPERLAVTDNAVHDLLATGIEDRILPVGAAAPGFILQDALTQKSVSSADLLALGPLVVKFFRGRWCPYCMTELETWQNLYPVLRERGALLVAISPQLLRQNDFTVQQHNLTFPVLSDPGSLVAASFGAAYTVPPPLRAHYRSILINIPFINGTQPSDDGNLANDPNSDATWRLPLAATFVIKKDNGNPESQASIVFSQAFADHRVRPEPQDVLAVL
jgi:peroxiredoxin